jgi:hypothetical protein
VLPDGRTNTNPEVNSHEPCRDESNDGKIENAIYDTVHLGSNAGVKRRAVRASAWTNC